MLIGLSFIWIVNIYVLSISDLVPSKPTPCFTDGDCPSALEKCAYGSWKGLGNCHRKNKEFSSSQLKRSEHMDARRIFRKRRLVRRKRNPINLWQDSHLPQKMWQVWVSLKQTEEVTPPELFSPIDKHGSRTPFDNIVADLLSTGRSYVTFNGVNITVTVHPAADSSSDWFIALRRDVSGMKDRRPERRILNSVGHKHYIHSTRHQNRNYATSLLEKPQNDSHNGMGGNTSAQYPLTVPTSQSEGLGIRRRFRRQVPLRSTLHLSADPLINRVAAVSPIIPAAEDIIMKSIDKRSPKSRKWSQRARRGDEEAESALRPLPAVLENIEDGPVIIEDLFAPKQSLSPLRKKRHHKHLTEVIRTTKNAYDEVKVESSDGDSATTDTSGVESTSTEPPTTMEIIIVKEGHDNVFGESSRDDNNNTEGSMGKTGVYQAALID
ncbi:uncharacterized protein LOC119109405 [Pollicipes pollicipes]|uniref:uncharacterized protein LOC119109405 n=1 Tax=Pollicipes pollicipes TaxID=41117 RepID=UPI001884BCC4|nr:uncharacterized protein LOC119109405 [Pollicipes pollicipes]